MDAAGEEAGEASAFALRAAANGSNGSKARLVPSVALYVRFLKEKKVFF